MQQVLLATGDVLAVGRWCSFLLGKLNALCFQLQKSALFSSMLNVPQIQLSKSRENLKNDLATTLDIPNQFSFKPIPKEPPSRLQPVVFLRSMKMISWSEQTLVVISLNLYVSIYFDMYCFCKIMYCRIQKLVSDTMSLTRSYQWTWCQSFLN